MANEPVILNVYDMVSLHQSPPKQNQLCPAAFFPVRNYCILLLVQRLQSRNAAPQREGEKAGGTPVPSRLVAVLMLEVHCKHFSSRYIDWFIYAIIPPRHKLFGNFKNASLMSLCLQTPCRSDSADFD